MTQRFVNGVLEDLTAGEEAERTVAQAQAQADYTANKYKGDRRQGYGSIEEQLDMIYWDQVNGTTTFQDHVAVVKADNPKPEGA